MGGKEKMFKPKAIYFEKDIENYKLGKELLEKYQDILKIKNKYIKHLMRKLDIMF